MVTMILAKMLASLISIYQYIIIFRLILSWFPQSRYSGNRLLRFVFDITDPVLNKFAQWFAFLRLGPFDFSPLLLFFLLDYLRGFFVSYYQQILFLGN